VPEVNLGSIRTCLSALVKALVGRLGIARDVVMHNAYVCINFDVSGKKEAAAAALESFLEHI
jgi:hypothetical protein